MSERPVPSVRSYIDTRREPSQLWTKRPVRSAAKLAALGVLNLGAYQAVTGELFDIDPPQPPAEHVMQQGEEAEQKIEFAQEALAGLYFEDPRYHEAQKEIIESLTETDPELIDAYNEREKYLSDSKGAEIGREGELLVGALAVGLSGVSDALYAARGLARLNDERKRRKTIRERRADQAAKFDIDPRSLEHELERNLLLPTIGSKLEAFDANGENIHQPWDVRTRDPSLVTTEHVEPIVDICNQLVKDRFGGARMFIQQIGVPVRYHEGFKPSALALIGNSPHPYDWSEPMFEAYWGKLNPMIHDGEGPNLGISPHWCKDGNHRGRTDFLYRYMKVPKGAEKLPDEEVERMKFEIDFYRRAALSFACTDESVVPFLTPKQRETLRLGWEQFTGQQAALYEEFGVSDVMTAAWFKERKSQSGDPHRWETAFADDVKTSLMNLEEIRHTQPRFMRSNRANMELFMDGVDAAIGITHRL